MEGKKEMVIIRRLSSTGIGWFRCCWSYYNHFPGDGAMLLLLLCRRFLQLRMYDNTIHQCSGGCREMGLSRS